MDNDVGNSRSIYRQWKMDEIVLTQSPIVTNAKPLIGAAGLVIHPNLEVRILGQVLKGDVEGVEPLVAQIDPEIILVRGGGDGPLNIFAGIELLENGG